MALLGFMTGFLNNGLALAPPGGGRGMGGMPGALGVPPGGGGGGGGPEPVMIMQYLSQNIIT